MRRFNPRVREEVRRNRYTVINNTDTPDAGPELLELIYKRMANVRADACIVNVLDYNKYAEVDLLQNGRIVDWGVPVFVGKE